MCAGVTVEQFEQAKSKLSTLQTDPGNEVKLKIYALFKQVGRGPGGPGHRGHLPVSFSQFVTHLTLFPLFLPLQATKGPCSTPKPGMLDFVNKAKWDAWKSLGSISQVVQGLTV